ncbi:MAG: hypothetical protein QM715_15330 [Nibricoccus sp.]
MIAPEPGPYTSAAKSTSRIHWRQVGWITLAAIVLYIVVRHLPTGTNLSHMDFRPGGSSVEFCDPANPQFMPVTTVRSPVAMVFTGDEVFAARSAHLALAMKTATGKPVGPDDLLVVHTQKLHLMIVDPTLTDYQHLHPLAGKKPGEWLVEFTPKRAGLYRAFADFTPAATARGLYASADILVKDSSAVPRANDETPTVAGPDGSILREGFRFTLQPRENPMRAGKVLDLTFSVKREDGAAVPLQTIMGAFAHLVAFDQERGGFAHLHPNEIDLAQKPDAVRPTLSFKVTIPKAGRYVVWAQVNLAGQDTAVPFWLDVQP